jgi:uncharacterized protein YjbJ (UPF0337 family)
MNWEQVKGNWNQAKGAIKKQWGELTDDQLDVVSGQRDILVGRIQETYGITRNEAERQVRDWETRQDASYSSYSSYGSDDDTPRERVKRKA